MERVSLSVEERQEVVRYGIERAGMELLFFGFVVLAGLIQDVFWYGLIFWFSFCFLRRFAGGYHADTRKRCGLISATIVVLSFLCIKYVSMNLPVGIFLQLGCYVVIMRLSPVDNINRVLEELAIYMAVNDTKMVCSFITYQPKLPEAVKKLKK